MKDYDKNSESSYLKYWVVNNQHGWAMSQKLPVKKIEWIEEPSLCHSHKKFKTSIK